MHSKKRHRIQHIRKVIRDEKENTPYRHAVMTSSPTSEQSGSIYLNSPMDRDHHEDTDMEYEISHLVLLESIN